ncbi:hypothetical protein NC653_025932 [Populus alba x Populus x berolinensis]|uniref:Uncharacterized protein n=1 Tax=Populus alba x Populus x berolinensis TaxID=444605 RepID=A0AAD6MCR7_9ROSI|nr:hypothetical protein NC653_025932 [Populus alba x Populus x berolinensis]
MGLLGSPSFSQTRPSCSGHLQHLCVFSGSPTEQDLIIQPIPGALFAQLKDRSMSRNLEGDDGPGGTRVRRVDELQLPCRLRLVSHVPLGIFMKDGYHVRTFRLSLWGTAATLSHPLRIKEVKREILQQI